MAQNALDRAIAAVAPAWAQQRMQARVRLDALQALDALLPAPSALLDPENRADYPTEQATPARRWWRPVPRDAQADSLPHIPFQRAASRELVRTSAIAAGAIGTNIDRVVGTGLALAAMPNMEVLGWSAEQAIAWKSHVEREFSMWADSPECDIEQAQTFYQLQALVLRGVLESGDTFTLLPDGERTPTQPYALRLQVLEADRVGNPLGAMDGPMLAGGVKLGPGGVPLSCYLYDRHPGGRFTAAHKHFAGQWVELKGKSGRKRLLHHLRKTRPGQVRGVPYLAPVIDCIKQIARYSDAEIMAAVITSYLTVFIETPTGDAAPVFDGQSGAGAPADVALGMGSVVGLMPGEKPHVVNPGRPNPNFEPFVLAVIRQIGMALGLPYELLVKQFGSSYSASKAALLDAWVYFRGVRFWLAMSFCQPVYETWLAEAVALGRVKAPGFFSDPLLRWAYTRAAWPGDSMGSISPKDEVAAYTAAIDARLMTRERAEWELFGSSWADTYVQKLTEFQRLAKDGMLPVPKAGAAAPQDPGQPPEDPADGPPATPQDKQPA